MSTLHDAIAAYLAPTHGHADPLTAATLDQCTLPGELGTPIVRPSWENEPIDPPHPWAFYIACLACGFFLFLLVGCTGLPQSPAADVPSAVQAACPPPAGSARTDVDALALHAAQVQAWHTQCAQAVAAALPGRADLASACTAPPPPVAGQAQAAAGRYAACRAALWHNPMRAPAGGMVWPLAAQRVQP